MKLRKNQYLMCFSGVMLFIVALLMSCGDDKKEDDSPRVGPVEGAFGSAEAAYGVPKRLMMAVAYLESRLNPQESYSLYLGQAKGISFAQSAFGIPRNELGVPGEAGDKLETQIDAYAKWASKKLAPLKLNPRPGSQDEKFSWIWELSNLHRRSDVGRTNIRVIFSLELINLLNAGFTWEDPTTKEVVTFPREEAQLIQSAFPHELGKDRAKIFGAEHLRFVDTDGDAKVQAPRGIEVIHCPFQMSACLELQSEGVGTRLSSHYIIPQDDSINSFPFQLRDHEESIPSTGPDGALVFSDRVVIMLTGYSGRVVNGARMMASPDWFKSWQLQRMGEVIGYVCNSLVTAAKEKDPTFTAARCKTVGEGVRFREVGADRIIRIGDIADFDASIFSAYISAPDGIADKASIRFLREDRIYEASRPVDVEFNVPLGAKTLEVEHLVRCGNQSLIWDRLLKSELSAKTKIAFAFDVFGAGPNANGSHYLRIKTYQGLGKNRKLMGWDTQGFLLTRYDEKQAGEDCL